MGGKYFKKDTVFVASGEGIQITAYTNKGNFSISSEVLTDDWHIENDYKPIERTEFMEAYLPIAKKINNKIAEL